MLSHMPLTYLPRVIIPQTRRGRRALLKRFPGLLNALVKRGENSGQVNSVFHGTAKSKRVRRLIERELMRREHKLNVSTVGGGGNV